MEKSKKKLKRRRGSLTFFLSLRTKALSLSLKWTRPARACPPLPQAAAGAAAARRRAAAAAAAPSGGEASSPPGDVVAFVDDQACLQRVRRQIHRPPRLPLLPPTTLLLSPCQTGRTLQEHAESLSNRSRCAGEARAPSSSCSPPRRLARRRRRRRRAISVVAVAMTTATTSSTASRRASSPRRSCRRGWESSGSAATCTRYE